MRRLLLCLSLALATSPLLADEDTSELWLGWQHQHRLDNTWQVASDLQLRSQDDGGPWRQLLVRPSVTRVLAPGLSASLGYAYVENRSITGTQTSEHRPWQQLQAQQAVGRGQFSQRLRLEQRFLESSAGDFTSDRARFQLRYQQPVGGQGHYLAVQNEVFVHLSAQDRLNGRDFDRNRLGVLAGFRLSPRVAVETGYLNERVGLRDGERVNHALTLNLVTRWP